MGVLYHTLLFSSTGVSVRCRHR